MEKEEVNYFINTGLNNCRKVTVQPGREYYYWITKFVVNHHKIQDSVSGQSTSPSQKSKILAMIEMTVILGVR